jgi:hypothetical protein
MFRPAMPFQPEQPDGQLPEVIPIRPERQYSRTAKGFGGLSPEGRRFPFDRLLH